MAIFRTCTCGRAFTLEQWRELPRCGIWDMRDLPAEPGERPLTALELRTCTTCGSTISQIIPYEGGSEFPSPALEGAGTD